MTSFLLYVQNWVLKPQQKVDPVDQFIYSSVLEKLLGL